MSELSEVKLQDVSKLFGDVTAVDNINLDIADGEFFSLLGPSGCGKTTTLRMIADFEPPTLGDQLNVLNDQRELMAAALFYLGYSPNSTDRAKLEEARDIILQAKPYYKTFMSDDYDGALLVPDEVVMSLTWSGDAFAAYDETYDEETEDGNWYYAIPEEGAIKWLDNICITASSERYDTAVHFKNYLMDAEVAAAVTNYTFFGSPNEAAKAFIEEEILEDPGVYPPEEVQAKLHWLEEIGDAVFEYNEMWTAIKEQ